MSTYAELKAQANALNARAEIARKQEIAEVIQRIKDEMKEYGVTLAERKSAVSSLTGTRRQGQRVLHNVK